MAEVKPSQKFHVVLQTKKIRLPHNLKLETTAPTEGIAKNHALYHLRKHGHDAFRVTKRVFSPHLAMLRDFLLTDQGHTFVQFVDESSEEWARALDLRAFIPAKPR